MPDLKSEYDISIVIPVYNGASTIADLVTKSALELAKSDSTFEFVLVNDGSPDESHDVILAMLEGDSPPNIQYIRLARNFGEHNAVMCGLRHSRGEAAVIIDDDFQNPPEEIMRLVRRLDEGFDVVYSYYEKKKHHWFRNLGSRFNDVVATSLLKKPPGLYLSSFKAINRFTIDAVTGYEGPYPYIDGLILRSTQSIGTQLCEHASRAQGESNYTLGKLVSLWLNMFTSFSVSPLRVASYLGFGMASLGFLLAMFFLISWSVGGILSDNVPKGWASLIITVTMFSGVQLLVLGLMGEYVGRIFMTQNNQPQAVVRKVYKNR